MATSIAMIAHIAAWLSPRSTADAMNEPRPGSLMSLFITEMASLCATKNHPPPKDIIEFQIKPCIEAGTSTVVKTLPAIQPVGRCGFLHVARNRNQ
jgi:hypothetical protein